LRTIFYPYRPHRHPDRFADGTQRKTVRHRAATHGATCESCALEISSFNCGHDAPDPCVIEGIAEQSGTHYFSVKDLDENRSTGSVKNRVETIDYLLRYYREQVTPKRKAEREIEA
jgi:predicted nucleotide-binding protein (sugar kinase/HSP70/actin superfamily)